MKPQSYQRQSILKKNNHHQIVGILRICRDNVDSIKKFQKNQEREKQSQIEEKYKEELKNQRMKKQMKIFLQSVEMKKKNKKQQSDGRIKLGGKGNDELPAGAQEILRSPFVEKTLSFFQCDDLRIAKRVEKYLKGASKVKQDVCDLQETEQSEHNQTQQIRGMIKLKNMNLKTEIDQVIDNLSIANKKGVKNAFYVEERRPDPEIKYRKFVKRDKEKNSRESLSLRPSLMSENSLTGTSFHNRGSYHESISFAHFRPKKAPNELKKLLHKVVQKFEKEYKKNSIFNKWERINAICQTKLLKGIFELEKYHSDTQLKEDLQELLNRESKHHDEQEPKKPSVKGSRSLIQEMHPKVRVKHLIKANKKIIQNEKNKSISRMFI